MQHDMNMIYSKALLCAIDSSSAGARAFILYDLLSLVSLQVIS